MQSYRFHNFDLLLDHAPDGYLARVIDSPVGQASAIFNLAGLTPVLDDPKGMGGQLYQAIFGGAIGIALRRSIDAATTTKDHVQGGLRIRLRLTSVPELATLPWESLYDAERDHFLALSDETPIVRYLDLAEPIVSLPVDLPLRLLVLVSDPVDFIPRLDIEREWAQLEAALAGLSAGSRVQIERLPARLASLQQRLRQTETHILHFIGHGWYTDGDHNGLLLEDDTGQAQQVAAERIAALLHDHESLRLIFLNACEGARSDAINPFAGVAQRLVQQHIPAVIAMQTPISDNAAIVLTREFYGALADGCPIDAALSEARKALFATGNNTEWWTPALFSRSADNHLLAITQPILISPAFTSTQQVDTGGGPYIAGNVTTGGDFVGRDQITIVVSSTEVAQTVAEVMDPARRVLAQPARSRKPFEPETVLIPAGCFFMGNDAVPDEAPQHSVDLPAYHIGKYAVTTAQYAEFVRQQRYPIAPESDWELAAVGQRPPAGKENHPMVGVSWEDALSYCRWLSEVTECHYRLPTEAEWEKAARGSEGQPYPWGNGFDPTRCNCKLSGNNATLPVNANSPAGDSPFGVAQMAGNCWEWTSTWWGSQRTTPEYRYPYQTDDGREEQESNPGPYREYRICRGGSFMSNPDRVTCSARGRYAADSRDAQRGFRVVLAI